MTAIRASAVTSTNPLKALSSFGQSVWLDYIRRSLITSGELQRLIDEDGLAGVTSNPSIFEKAIAGSNDYADKLAKLNSSSLDAKGIYEEIAVGDIQDAADILKQVYTATKRRDGYVSLEVSPTLANDTNGTVEEARRLWKRVNRENVMIKVPATPAGVPAIQQLIGEGININVTLLFAQEAYEKVAEAYISGLEKFAASGGDVSRMASVASFFISRIDTLVDNLLEAKIHDAQSDSDRQFLRSLCGKVAIANGKLTYEKYKQLCSSPRWNALKSKGAQTQRLLWASTSTKNPNYRDVLYVEELIGPDTVDTIPPATFDGFRDHGVPRETLESNLDAARQTMQNLSKSGISMEEVTDKLLDDGVKLFADAFDKLLSAIEKNRNTTLAPKIDQMSWKLPADLAQKVNATIAEWEQGKKMRRLWGRDSSLWTNSDESNWLGWLAVTDDQIAHFPRFASIADEVQRAGFTHIALLGMGGSSLCPEVMNMTFGRQKGFPEFHMLDSTDPAQLKDFESKLNLKTTLFIVSSKSGSTLEPNIFKQYFFERMKQVVGADKVGEHFLAITDPGSSFEKVAQRDKFRRIFHGRADIGGRYSALSDFGLVPSAVIGINLKKLLSATEEMVHACSATVPVADNPGAVLGIILGVHCNAGKDKVTLIASPGISDLGAWLEQLLAESTGKQGKGIIPVDREEIGAPNVYGSDRLFVYIRLQPSPDAAQDAKVDALEKAGLSVVRIQVLDKYDIGQEFFRWEIATAVAGSIIGINCFNQPDVEASKIETRELTKQYEETGSLPAETPLVEDQGMKLYADGKYAGKLTIAVGKDKSLAAYLRAHLSMIGAGDYFALLAYINRNDANQAALESTRTFVRDKKQAATCLGFGPRFLHSTGQAYKGGPNTGVFLQITCDDASDLTVPGQKYTFGVVKAAQARGDFQVLSNRNRRALRVHLGKDVSAGLATLDRLIRQTCQ
ncbi:MAG TPA: bifunctional transaldolase/phosoglucose isomerase [Terriglobales bacterium]|nr:bifunctional transaldolase/phosoglucose isomerase [Terriglobales bacterium]